MRAESPKRKPPENARDKGAVLVMVSIVVTRHCDGGNSCKGKYLIGFGLQVQPFRQLATWREAWQHTGRCGAGKRT